MKINKIFLICILIFIVLFGGYYLINKFSGVKIDNIEIKYNFVNKNLELKSGDKFSKLEKVCKKIKKFEKVNESATIVHDIELKINDNIELYIDKDNREYGYLCINGKEPCDLVKIPEELFNYLLELEIYGEKMEVDNFGPLLEPVPDSELENNNISEENVINVNEMNEN